MQNAPDPSQNPGPNGPVGQTGQTSSTGSSGPVGQWQNDVAKVEAKAKGKTLYIVIAVVVIAAVVYALTHH